MKILVEIFAGLIACGSAYYLALPRSTDQEMEAPSVARRNVGVGPERPHVPEAPPPIREAVGAPPPTPGGGVDAGPSREQESAMTMLRNEVIVATSKDMHQRGEDVLKCLDGAQLAGAQKLRFSIDVVSTPFEATTGRWRFVEIADGEPLPDSFASCAARAFGGGQHLVPPKDFHFPDYRGDLLILYTIPAPSGD